MADRAFFFLTAIGLVATSLESAQAQPLQKAMKRAVIRDVAVTAPGSATTVNLTAPLTDEQLLRTAGLSGDGPALLEFFRGRTLGEGNRDQVAALIGKLGSGVVAEREGAVGQLVALGSPAAPLIRQATRDLDLPEVAALAQRCLQFIEGDKAPTLSVAATRLLALKKPPGAAQALLDFLPCADDDTVLDEIKTALLALATLDNKVDPIFFRALDDSSSLRRVIVGEVLCKIHSEEALMAVRKLLHDPRPAVRLRLALALAAIKDADAVGTLVGLLGELPPALGRQAEEFLMSLAGEQGPKVSLGSDEAARKQCSEAWGAWWRGTEGTAPLQEFKKRTLNETDREKVLALAKQLGDDSFPIRERAQAALQEYGSSIAPLLRQAANTEDEEIKKRAQKVLEVIDKEKNSPLLPMQARLVALRKPEGSSEVLLAFLPFADEEQTFDEVRAALAAVAVRGTKHDPLLIKALQDKLPLRRAVAAEALVVGGATQLFPTVRKLLRDPDPSVRLRVGLALGSALDREAVPVLIDLLAELPPDKGTQAELFLRSLGGDQAPNVFLGPDEASRQKVKDSWTAWWKENGATVDLSRVLSGPRMLGYTLLIATDFSRIVEVGLDGKARWQLDNLQYPRDAQVLNGDRILVAEQNIQRVSEWTLKREVVWQKQVNGPPVNCQRLPNGNTFIAMSNGLLEVDRTGKEVFTYNRPNYDIMSAHRSTDGQMVFVTQAGVIVRLDAAGKELKNWSIGGQAPWSVELLPGGRILVPHPGHNRVVEYDPEGKIVWEIAVQNPFSAVRLPNGNTLVSSYNQMKVVEVNRSGRVVWEHKTANSDRSYRAKRR